MTLDGDGGGREAAIEKRIKHISFGCRGLSRDGTVGKSMRDTCTIGRERVVNRPKLFR